ncbi:MAG TPA: tetratricopeptide repeat protein [Xanthobacteraceae bacterium]|nr:tetratricopeptide repeat protein [Xanthobacteraceae bacterium]
MGRVFVRIGFAVALAPIGLFGLGAGSIFAQTSADFSGTLNPLFLANLAQPSDISNALQYAASASVDDIESAIGTYEQLLFYNPTLSKIRFELGVLYYRLGSYEMARGYFKSALEQQDCTPELRRRMEDLLVDVDKQLLADRFTGFVQTGLGYQTNPGGGPGPQTVLASGRSFDSRFFAKGDGNWFGAFALNYVHDFENQRGDTFEATVQGYDAQQFSLHQFDVGTIELRAGPRFVLTPGSPYAVSIKPYVVATGALLADTAYSGGIGGGMTLHATLGNVAIDPFAEMVQQSFRNSSFYPLASNLSGPLTTIGLQASGPVASGLSWQTRGAFAHSSASFGPDSYDAYAADLWLPWNFSPLGDGRMWTLTPIAGLTHWQYSAPDPNIDPLTTPRTTEWRVGLGLDVPIWSKVYMSTLVQYRADTSNIPAFTMHDLSISGGPTFKF